MRIIETQMLPASASIVEALREAKRAGAKLAVATGRRMGAAKGGRTRIYSVEALKRASQTHGETAALSSLPSWTSAQIPSIWPTIASGVRSDIRARLESPRVAAFMKSNKRSVAYMTHGTGRIALVSVSEEYIVVTYRCGNSHPYYPPPAWSLGKRCWCTAEIIRED